MPLCGQMFLGLTRHLNFQKRSTYYYFFGAEAFSFSISCVPAASLYEVSKALLHTCEHRGWIRGCVLFYSQDVKEQKNYYQLNKIILPKFKNIKLTSALKK